MNPYQLGLYEKSMPGELSIPHKLKEAKAAGFDYLELSIDESDEKQARLHWNDAELHTLCEAQYAAGLPIRSICLSGHRRFPLGHPSGEVRAKSLEIMRNAIRIAAHLGVRIIQLAGYDVYYEPSSPQTRTWFSENLAQCVQMAAREGVVLAFETMETPFMNTVEKAVEWVEQINSPYLQVYPDIGNITNAALEYGVSPVDDLQRGEGHLAAVHLKETIPGVFREVPYGTGHVDFPSLMMAAFRLGARMYVGEFWYDGSENWRETLRQNNRFLRHHFERLMDTKQDH